MTELILEEIVFKKTKLNETISLILLEQKFKQHMISEGFVDIINYGVTTRAVDKYFGGKKQLEELVKKEMMKKYGKTDITKLDPKEIENEITQKANSAAKKLASQEFINGVFTLLRDGLLNGLINAFINSIISFIFTLDPREVVKSFIKGFILGVLVEFLFKIIGVVYNEVKKRVLKDPYATPSRGETLALVLITIVVFTTTYGMFLGASTNAIIAMVMINILLSMFLTVLLNIGKVAEMVISIFSKKQDISDVSK